jgi:hypothetical protein
VTSARILAICTAGALAIGLLASCSSDTSGSGSATASSSGGAASSGRTGSSAAASSSAGSSAAAAPTDCTGSQIRVTAINPPGGGAAGHRGVVLLFTNAASTPCLMTGYPGVDGLGSGGNHVASASRTLNGMIGFCGCTKPATVTVPPGGAVSAVTEGVSDGSGPCDPFYSLLITPPNTSTSTPVAIAPYSCGFTVHPVVTGQTGQSGTP